MDSARTFLKSLVVIHYNPDTLEPKPTLAYEAMLRATVRLNIQEAQWAILEQNNTVYHLALNQAINHLEHTFSSDSTRTQALIQQLEQLKKTNFRAELVMPEEALNQLNSIINTPRTAPLSTEGAQAS